jgi:hypothetical protein
MYVPANHRHAPDPDLLPSADQAVFSIAFDKLDTVFAVLIREIPEIHRRAEPEPPEVLSGLSGARAAMCVRRHGRSHGQQLDQWPRKNASGANQDFTPN